MLGVFGAPKVYSREFADQNRKLAVCLGAGTSDLTHCILGVSQTPHETSSRLSSLKPPKLREKVRTRPIPFENFKSMKRLLLIGKSIPKSVSLPVDIIESLVPKIERQEDPYAALQIIADYIHGQFEFVSTYGTLSLEESLLVKLGDCIFQMGS